MDSFTLTEEVFLDDIKNHKIEILKDESRFGNGIKEFSVREFRNNVITQVLSYLDLEKIEDIPKDVNV